MNIEFLKKIINNKLKLFLLVSFIILWLSLGTNPTNLYNYSWNYSNFTNTLNFFLSIATLIIPIIITFILLIIKKKKLNFLKLGLLPIFIILYFICQIIGIILSNNEFINLYFTLNGLSTLFILVLIYRTFSKEEFNFFLIISIIILATSFLFYFYKYLKVFILIDGQTFYGAWGAVSFLENNETIPRPTGLARTGLILFICLYFAYFINNRKKIFYVLIFLATSIYLFQSRLIISLYVLFIFSSYFFFKKNLIFFELKKTILIFLIIPILLFSSLIFLKIKLVEHSLISKEFIYKMFNLNDNDNTIYGDEFHRNFKSNSKYLRTIDPETFTSGRVRDWEKILSAELKIFGYGPQGDRKLTNGSTAANAFLYALSSAGIIGFLIMILIYFQIIKELYKIYLEKKNYNFYIYSSIFILIILLIRSILESSFAVFGIDYIFFLQCYLIIKKREKNIK
jgi:hypothetical protein